MCVCHIIVLFMYVIGVWVCVHHCKYQCVCVCVCGVVCVRALCEHNLQHCKFEAQRHAVLY